MAGWVLKAVSSLAAVLSFNKSISIIQTDGNTLIMYKKQLGQKLKQMIV